jgi:cardiolipin synthase A/B
MVPLFTLAAVAGESQLPWWHGLEVQLTAMAGALSIILTIPWILMTKKEATSAIAWCLVVFMLPILGTLFFVIFGYQHVHRPLRRKREHRKQFHARDGDDAAEPGTPPEQKTMAALARRFGASPLIGGNHVQLFHDGTLAFETLLEAIERARHHIHLEYFIIQPDSAGDALFLRLIERARAGVEVRVLYDAMGSRRLKKRHLRRLAEAGIRSSVFLPLNPLRRRIQINMRDHRKIAVIDGEVAFTGGLNVGDEYLGLVDRFGYWRDSHLRLEGPAVGALQRIFIEDWDFAAGETLSGTDYLPELSNAGEHAVQVIASGPERDLNGIRELYFAAILQAQKRLWIASPYFVPDGGLRDALCLAAYRGVDVRLLGQHHPDKWIPYFAGRYYWADILAAGGQVYQYTNGMMHSKVILVDDQCASVGSANLDNRSLHLNFEVNCLLYSPELVSELSRAMEVDFERSIELDWPVYQKRPLTGRVIENSCRLLSPLL